MLAPEAMEKERLVGVGGSTGEGEEAGTRSVTRARSTVVGRGQSSLGLKSERTHSAQASPPAPT